MRLLGGFALTVAMTTAAWAQTGATGTLLIGNKGEDTVSFVDLASGEELGRAATGKNPHEIAISPDGAEAAVVAYGGRTIDIFDVAARAKTRTIDLAPNEGPHGVVWLPDGRIVATTERSQSLTIVDTAKDDAISAISTGQQGTHMVAISPDARFAFTANIQSGSVSVIDLGEGRLIRNIQLGGAPEAIALTPDGATLWVGDNEGARVLAFDAAMLAGDEAALGPVVNLTFKIASDDTAAISAAIFGPVAESLKAWPGAIGVDAHVDGNLGWIEVSLAPGAPLPSQDETIERVRAAVTGTVLKGRTEIAPRILSATPLATVATGAVPIRVAASPDGRWIVTSDLGAGGLTVIDARTRAVARHIPVSGAKEAGQVTILFSGDGQRVYVAETGRNEIAEVDLAEGRVLRRLPAGAQGDGLAIAP